MLPALRGVRRRGSARGQHHHRPHPLRAHPRRRAQRLRPHRPGETRPRRPPRRRELQPPRRTLRVQASRPPLTPRVRPRPDFPLSNASVAPQRFESMALPSETGSGNPDDFQPETLRGSPGFFRVARSRAGRRWWFIDPHDQPVFLRSVTAVTRHAVNPRRAGPPDPVPPGGEAAPFAREASRRLLGWGFNTLGPRSDADLAGLGLPQLGWGCNARGPSSDADVAGLGLHLIGRADVVHAGGPVIHAHGLLLPDVLDPSWTACCEARAKRAAEVWRGRTDLVGLHTDAD